MGLGSSNKAGRQHFSLALSSAVTSKPFYWYVFKERFLISEITASLYVLVVVNYTAIAGAFPPRGLCPHTDTSVTGSLLLPCLSPAPGSRSLRERQPLFAVILGTAVALLVAVAGKAGPSKQTQTLKLHWEWFDSQNHPPLPRGSRSSAWAPGSLLSGSASPSCWQC